MSPPGYPSAWLLPSTARFRFTSKPIVTPEDIQLSKQFSSIVGRSCFEDSVDGVEHFAGNGHERLQFGFVARLKSIVEGSHVRVPSHCCQSRHIECAAQVAVAGAADARTLMH